MQLKNKKVMVLGCNNNQVPYIESIKLLGASVIGTDLNQNAPGKAICDKFFNVGYDDYEGLTNCLNTANPDYLFSAAAQFSYLGISHLAEKLGLDFPNLKSVSLCLDKRQFYDEFKNYNIPIPVTHYVKNESELTSLVLKESKVFESFYLKSDHSKNPNYIYKFNKKDNLESLKINWTKDRYFKDYYILQNEFFGEHLRINMYENFCNVYKFSEKNGFLPSKKSVEKVKSAGIFEKLYEFRKNHKLHRLLTKYDVVLNESNEFVVLDIGLDPPYRMKHDLMRLGYSFPDLYVQQYLNQEINYPVLENSICY